ncbi:hypothetical protein [Nocardia callitridis]
MFESSDDAVQPLQLPRGTAGRETIRSARPSYVDADVVRGLGSEVVD